MASWDFGIGAVFSKILYGVPEAQELFKNLPGARGVVFPKYEPILSHGDPIHAPNYTFREFLATPRFRRPAHFQ